MDDFSFWDVIASMFWFMLLFAWIWMFMAILGDIFRDRTLSGGAKAMWTVFLVFLPWVGALIYLIARGGSMNERAMEAAKQNEERMRAYVQNAAGTTSVAEEMRHLAELKTNGMITEAEYEQAKAKVLA